MPGNANPPLPDHVPVDPNNPGPPTHPPMPPDEPPGPPHQPPGQEPTVFMLNDMNGDFDDGLGYTATNGADIFVYDFASFDFEIQDFQIHNFDTSEDTLVFVNSETPDRHPPLLFDFETKDPDFYWDSEQSADPEGGPNLHNFQSVFAPTRFDDDHYTAQRKDTDVPEAGTTFDRIFVYEDDGTTLASIDSLDYNDVSTDPIANDSVAYVYEGDPLADGLLA